MCDVFTKRIPSCFETSISGSVSIKANSRAAANLALVKSGANKLDLPICIPPNVIVAKTLKVKRFFLPKII